MHLSRLPQRFQPNSRLLRPDKSFPGDPKDCIKGEANARTVRAETSSLPECAPRRLPENLLLTFDRREMCSRCGI